ncbi:hypothetical protein M427DRAFT_53373 [Gonapodya prolifera JEL478]|uniref:F-box domain-containing protein n=1 Tax=Gonapodya prolifera (strain JEL478) TaxID=1344416 RepID=A0A139AQ69_GONPJ|nr:hypothetical protein M427DRAFT_53373 [Gonapodya prolifera JEL478]|eukprot:KXS18890.1 hypothetical protein M427DRAFT_53373 [Gonapodya prolifera JEL478]
MTTRASDRSPVVPIPPEILSIALSFLPPAQLVECALTSKAFANAALPLLWREFHVFRTADARLSTVFKSTRNETYAPYSRYIRSIVSGWRDGVATMKQILPVVGRQLSKLDLWRLSVGVLTPIDMTVFPAYLGPHLTHLDVSEWNGRSIATLPTPYRTIEDQVLDGFCRACPNIRALWAQETDLSPALLVSLSRRWFHLNEVWFGHPNYFICEKVSDTSPNRYTNVLSSGLLEELAASLGDRLVELGLFSMNPGLSIKDPNILRHFLMYCPKLKRLTVKQCDVARLCADVSNLQGRYGTSQGGLPIVQLRIKVTTTECESLCDVINSLVALESVHLTIYLSPKQKPLQASLPIVARLAHLLGTLPQLRAVRMAVELSSVAFQRERDSADSHHDMDSLLETWMAELVNGLGKAKSLEQLGLKLFWMDSHSRRLALPPKALDALFNHSLTPDDQPSLPPLASRLTYISLSAHHLHTPDALQAFLLKFPRLRSALLRYVEPSVYDWVKDECFGGTMMQRRRWVGDVECSNMFGVGANDPGEGPVNDLFENDSGADWGYSTCFVKLGTVASIKNLCAWPL